LGYRLRKTIRTYINMGKADTILCPYCATRFRFDPQLTASDADPPDSFFADHNTA
jgi:Zinc-finger domain